MRTRAKAGAVDAALLCSAFGIEEPTIDTLLDAPTVDLVKDLLATLTVKAKDFDTLKAEKLRADVELENTIRSNESRVKGLKTTVNKGLQEIEELRKKLDEQDNARAELHTELDALKASSTDSSSELDTLRARVSTLEASNRDTLAVLEAKSTAHDKLAEELAAQHQKILALRREISALEDKNQSLENAASATRFKEQALQQEVDLLKRNNEWHETELKTRTAEHTKFRKEKNARISELQRANEEATVTVESMKRTEASLKQRLDQLNQKADDAFAKIQKMQEDASKAEESFRVEIDSAHRLANLQKQSADTAKARLQELQNTIEQIKESAADEVGQLQAEVETERSDREAVEQKLAELELEIERLQTATVSHPPAVPSIPGTPQRGSNGLVAATPGRDGSPAPFTPATLRAKGNLTFTQLYSEYSTVKSQLEVEKRRNFQLSSELDEMIHDLENRGPEQEELRLEKERVEAEIVDMSTMLDAVIVERDEARREARSLGGQIDGLTRESDILRQQLRDLSAQIKIILVEMQARDQGLEALDAAGQMQLQMLVNGELDDQSSSDETSAGALISQRLLLFRNVRELQEQNMQLLKLNRGLAERMEGDAAKARQAEQENALQELGELRERLQRHQDEIRTMTTQAESIKRERDMFRRMLSHRGQLPPGADVQAMFGQSVDGRATPSTPTRGSMIRDVDQTPHSKDLADYAKLLKDMQSHFDAYRQEAATDHTTLKQQVDHLAREKSELQGEVARTSGQMSLAHERYEMLQSNYAMLKVENGELQKRSQSLAEAAAKQDLRTQQVAEELVEARALADSMRTDTANLRAERELWKKIEARLTEDNRALMDDRSRLNKMIADLQNLQNERELADSETRRRLQSKVESLEAEVDSTKKKLENEVEEARKAALRREYDQDQNRTRIDDLVKSLSSVREELVAAKTTRDQLQARVDELKIELRTAEERAQALQPRPTPRAEQTSGTAEEAETEESLAREQDLALQVTELKRDLDLARNELENAKAEVEQYKAISQASEEELESMNETHDRYREEMDLIIAEKDGQIQDLQRRIEELGAELSTSNTELSALRTQHEEGVIRLEEQKHLLEAEVSRLHDQSERYAETAKLHQEDLKAQAEIAQQAQQSYENELVKHADAAKNLQTVRSEYNQLRTEVAAIKAESEAAKASLSQSEESWSEVRERYEREISEIRLGREDLRSQNKLLHEQLESVSAQISALQQKKGSNPEEDEDTPAGSEFENLQEVIKYLRREKEIVDVQYELSVQEGKRLRQQLDYTHTQLDEVRQKLNEERQDQADKEANAASHNKLVQTINELNLYRESSATLRHEAKQAQTQLSEKVKEVEQLTAQLEPLQSRIREVENELETKEGEMKLLQEDRDRWRDRTQNIISKYDRVDPAEMEALRTQITELQTERDQLVSEKQQLQEQVDTIPERLEQVKAQEEQTWQATKAKFVEQAKNRSREQSGKIRDLDQELVATREKFDRVQQELASVMEELETTRVARDDALARVEEVAAQQEAAASETEEGQIETQAEEAQSTQPSSAVLLEQLQQAEARAADEANRAANLEGEVETLQSRISELESQVVSLQLCEANMTNTKLYQADLQQRLDESNASLTQSQNQEPAVDNGENSEHIEKLKEDLATAQSEVETLRASLAAGDVAHAAAPILSPNGTGEISSPSVSEQVAEQVKKLEEEFRAQHERSKEDLENSFKQRIEDMKKKLNDKFKEIKEKVREEGRNDAIAQHSEEMENLRQEHEAAIRRLNEEHGLEIERLTREGQVAVEKAQAREQSDAAPAQEQTQAAESTPNTKVEAFDASQLNFTEEQARALAKENTVIRKIIVGNIGAKTQPLQAQIEELKGENEKMKEETTKIQEESEKTLQEKIEEAKKDKEKAIAAFMELETKKQAVRLGMLQNQVRNNQAKIDVVKEAATETPQKPVVEVWEIVKITKAPPPAPTGAAPGATPVQAAKLTQTPAGSPMKPAANGIQSPSVQSPKPTPPVQAVQPQQLPQAAAQAAQDKVQARIQKFGAPSGPIQPSAPQQASSTFGRPSFTPGASLPAGGITSQTGAAATVQPGMVAQPTQHSGQAPALASAPVSAIPRTASMLPRAPLPAGARSGIPQAGFQNSLNASQHAPGNGSRISIQGAATRGGAGSGLPRGGGAGRGRGNGGAGRGGPQGGAMNTNARQFVPTNPGQPGNKRPYEGGEEGAGKRVKGPGGN